MVRQDVQEDIVSVMGKEAVYPDQAVWTHAYQKNMNVAYTPYVTNQCNVAVHAQQENHAVMGNVSQDAHNNALQEK